MVMIACPNSKEKYFILSKRLHTNDVIQNICTLIHVTYIYCIGRVWTLHHGVIILVDHHQFIIHIVINAQLANV